jgi:hypothetical protein
MDQIEDIVEELLTEFNQRKGAVAEIDAIIQLGSRLAQEANPDTDPNAESDQ